MERRDEPRAALAWVGIWVTTKIALTPNPNGLSVVRCPPLTILTSCCSRACAFCEVESQGKVRFAWPTVRRRERLSGSAFSGESLLQRVNENADRLIVSGDGRDGAFDLEELVNSHLCGPDRVFDGEYDVVWNLDELADEGEVLRV